MGFDFSEARVLVSRVAKAAHKEPFERVALQFESFGDFPRRGFLQFLEVGTLGDQTFDDAAGDASPLLADAVALVRECVERRDSRGS